MKKKIGLIIMCILILAELFGAAGNDDTGTDESASRTVQSTESIQDVKTDDEKENTEQKIEESEETDEDSPYTYTRLDTVMYATTAVNVRNQPGTSGDKIGGLKKGQSVSVTGQCNETKWYRVDIGGKTGYVSHKYLKEGTTFAGTENTQVANANQETVKTREPVATEQPHSTVAATPEPAAVSTPQPVTTPQPVVQTPESSDTGSGNLSSGGGGNGVTVPTEAETGANLVWVPTNGGTKYHRTSSCSSMIDPIQVSVETAVDNGYTPCKRCYK